MKRVLGGVLTLTFFVSLTAANARVRTVAGALALACAGVILYRERHRGPRVREDEAAADDAASAPVRFAWAVWLGSCGFGCVVVGQIIGAFLPPLLLPLRALGVFLLLAAAYKLFFGRKSDGRYWDVW